MRKDTDGLPAVGGSATSLGVRVDKDIDVDEEGIVYPESGGMSVSRSLKELAPWRRPNTLSGGECKHPGWVLDTRRLPEFLVARREEGTGHAYIEPAYAMDLDAYQDALASTRADWQECT
jgi:hypothetical protein